MRTQTNTNRTNRTRRNHKARRTADIRRAIRYGLPALEYATTGCKTIGRDVLVSMLGLRSIAPTTDPDGDHVVQELVSKGVLSRPDHGRFDRDDVITALKAWTA